MNTRRLNLQLILIFTIIVTAFLGSALFFSYLNTDAMMTAVEKETGLAASILTADIHGGNAILREDVDGTPEELAREMDARLTQALDEVGVDIDVWVVSETGAPVYSRGDVFPKDEWESTKRDMRDADASSMRWIGQNNPFWLNQSLFLAHRIAGSDMYLVALNHCSAIQAVQRQQVALFIGIEMVLILTMIVLLTNTISSYRRLLIQMATTDELTGLANRKSFLTTFEEFRAKRPGEEYALFLVDIDYFKKINDTYGHAAGDAALKTLARHIADMAARCQGFAGRWGGDEFIGVLPLSGEEAREALSDLCRAVSQDRLEDGMRVTISVGAALANVNMPLAQVSEMADRALYCSKARGKNQANLYSAQDDRLENDAPVPPERFETVPRSARAEKAKQGPELGSLSPGQRFRRFLRDRLLPSMLLGVRWMAPFVAGGGILIGLAFLFDAASVDLASLPVAQRANFGSITQMAATLKRIGDSTFNFMLPAFAGFMAYGFAGENAFLAGFIGGYMTIDSQSGFIGAMVAGFTAGVIATQMQRFMEHMPQFLRKAAPIIIYPVFNLLLMQGISLFIISPLSRAVGSVFTVLLDTATAKNSLWAGTLSGAMMALDFGGIVNKVAYNYGVTGLSAGKTVMMASVMAGGMIPPLGVALSMVLFRRKYSPDERERGIGTLFMGLSFITEGALPFVFTDPLRVVPACLLGSAFAGFLSVAFGCALPAPHGGLFVVPVMDRPVLFLIALLGGSALTAVVLGLWKKEWRPEGTLGNPERGE